jgi:hypothetical protein
MFSLAGPAVGEMAPGRLLPGEVLASLVQTFDPSGELVGTLTPAELTETCWSVGDHERYRRSLLAGPAQRPRKHPEAASCRWPRLSGQRPNCSGEATPQHDGARQEQGEMSSSAGMQSLKDLGCLVTTVRIIAHEG